MPESHNHKVIIGASLQISKSAVLSLNYQRLLKTLGLYNCPHGKTLQPQPKVILARLASSTSERKKFHERFDLMEMSSLPKYLTFPFAEIVPRQL